jgi:hypothetical protein
MLQSITSSCTTEKSHGVPSIGYSSEALRQDLERVTKIWRNFQSSRARDAVYSYLAAIFALVEWWAIDKRAISRARLALRLRSIEVSEEIEPFAAVIVATSHPAKLDKRMISKWSRVLRYAAEYKTKSEPLQQFIKRKGGLNACAARYARRLGRWAA